VRANRDERLVLVGRMETKRVTVGVLDAVEVRVDVRVRVGVYVSVMVGERVTVEVLVIVAVAERAATVRALAVFVPAIMISTKPVGPARMTPCWPCNSK